MKLSRMKSTIMTVSPIRVGAADDEAEPDPVIEAGREGDGGDDALVVFDHVRGAYRQRCAPA